MQYKTVLVKQQKQSGGFFGIFESLEEATTRTIMENIQDDWRFVSAFSNHPLTIYLIFEKL
jgi:hypothetical protein